MIFLKFCGHKCLSHALSQSAVSSHRSTKTREVTDQSQLPYYELAEEDGGTNGRNVRGQSCRLFFEFLCCARRFFSKELFEQFSKTTGNDLSTSLRNGLCLTARREKLSPRPRRSWGLIFAMYRIVHYCAANMCQFSYH